MTPQTSKYFNRWDAYCKHICNSLHLHTVQSKFLTQDDKLSKLTQRDKTFEALIVPKSLAPTILIHSHSLKGCAGTVKTICPIKRYFFWKGMCTDISEFIQKCHTCKEQKSQNHSYRHVHIKPGKRPFNSIVCNLFSPFHSPSSMGN